MLAKAGAVKCAFCGAQAAHPCSWPVEKPASISHWDLEESHVIVSKLAKRELRPLTVRRFNMWSRGGVRHPVTMYALKFPDGRYFLYFLYGRDRVQVLNPAECESPCCEAHLREVGENTRYCMAHWSAWQTVEVTAA